MGLLHSSATAHNHVDAPSKRWWSLPRSKGLGAQTGRGDLPLRVGTPILLQSGVSEVGCTEKDGSVSPAWAYALSGINALVALLLVVNAPREDWQLAPAFLPAAGVAATLAGVSFVRAPRSTPTVRADVFVLVGLLLAGLAALIIPLVVVDPQTVRSDPGPLILRNFLTAGFAVLIAFFATLAASPCGRRPLCGAADDGAVGEHPRHQEQSGNDDVDGATQPQSDEGLSDASPSTSVVGDVPPSTVGVLQMEEPEAATDGGRTTPLGGSGPLARTGRRYETAAVVRSRRTEDASFTSTTRERVSLSLCALASFLLGALFGFSTRRNR